MLVLSRKVSQSIVRSELLTLEPPQPVGLCLCVCGCTTEAGGDRYVCRFCGRLWRSGDGGHSPPTAGVARRLREDED